MTCPHTQLYQTSILEGTLGADERRQLQQHVQDCEPCQAAFQEMDLLETVLQEALATPSSAQQAAAEVLQRLQNESGREPQAALSTARILCLRRWCAAAALLLMGILVGRALQPRQPGLSPLHERPMRVAQIKGTVLVNHQGSDTWRLLEEESRIYQGDTFHTTAAAALVLSLDDTNTVRLAQNSILVLEACDSDNTQFYLQHGQCTPVLHGPHGPFFIRTPNGRMEALGTEFTVKVSED